MRSPELEKQLLMLRQEHEHLFFIGAGEFESIVRPLTLVEVKILSSCGPSLGDHELNDWIVDRCCLWATDGKEKLFTTAPAGVVDILAKGIVSLSKFQTEESFREGLENARKEINKFENQIMVILLATFKDLTPKAIENMTFYQQMKYLALAEVVSGKPIPINDGKKKKGKKMLSPEAAAILSKEAADRPDIDSDNRSLSQFLTGRERMDHGG
jgi:hypothetical protein